MKPIALVLLVLAIAAPAAAQEHVVTPTYIPERACCQSVPCEGPAAPATPVQAAPLCTPPRVIRYERRSSGLFWTGVAMIGAGATFVIASTTWARESGMPGYPVAPCGTDPFLTRLPIAPCQTNAVLLAAGASLAGTGAALMVYGGQHVAIGSDGRQITVRVHF